MAYVISDACISCGSCADACPVGAIAQGADHYEINAVLAWTAVPAPIAAP